MPMSIKMPITTGSEIGSPVSSSASTTPPRDRGSADKIVMG